MNPQVDANRDRRIRRKLFRWFDRQRRDLPWRRTRDPYAIWLSEIMLQQTQVATVVPYYRRFLSRFPSVQALAAADLDETLRIWAGLGYYARARNLHRAARRVASEFGGRFPRTVEGLRTLPGVGAYTAAAVASIAFGVRAAAVDGNVSRVMARLLDFRGDVRTGRGSAVVREVAERLLPRVRCGDFNQAMMELGAMVCRPGAAARCPVCPLRVECLARAAGTVARFPVKERRAVVKTEIHLVAAVEREGRWLIRQRPARGLWGGLWELPTAVSDEETDSARTFPAARVVERLAEDTCGAACRVEPSPFCDLRHQLSHRTIRFVGYVCHAGCRRRTPGLKSRSHPSLRGQGELNGPAEDVASASRRPLTSRCTSGGQGGRRTVGADGRDAHRAETHVVQGVTPIPSAWLSLDELDSLGLSRAMRKVVEHLKKRMDNG